MSWQRMNKHLLKYRKKILVCVVSLISLSVYCGEIPVLVYAQESRTKRGYSPTIPLSKAECVMEQSSRRILYELNADICLPMAITTKILTAATVIDICKDIEQEIAIPHEAIGVEGSSAYLQEEERYTIKDLLYGLMLRSGNDCATALALYCCGDIAKFSAKMNEKAVESGAISSNFRNPHGLPCKDHYTTARDLSFITCTAMDSAIFRRIVATQYYPARAWKNKNKMLVEYSGAVGVKTGYTKEAGRCLVTAAVRNGMSLVCTVLNSPMMYERSRALLDDAFSAYSYVKLLSPSDIFEVERGAHRIRACTREEFYYPLLEDELEWVEMHILPENESTDKEIVGQIQITLAKRLIFSGILYKL